MARKARMQVDVQFVAQTMQQCINEGVNGMAVELLAESLGDKDKLVDGGVMFSFPHDHAGRPIWVIVTAQAPLCVEHVDVPEAAAEPTAPASAPTMTREQAAEHLLDVAGYLISPEGVAAILNDGKTADRIGEMATSKAHPKNGGDAELFGRVQSARERLLRDA